MPRVSVIIPTYNHAQFVVQAVESALAQTYADLEVIIVDDGSTDDTQAVLARYGAEINYIYQENQGLSAARNAGISVARGDYFLFLDADDLVLANKLELQVSIVDAQPDFGLVYRAFNTSTKMAPEFYTRSDHVSRATCSKICYVARSFSPRALPWCVASVSIG